jgi:hypothetical protein
MDQLIDKPRPRPTCEAYQAQCVCGAALKVSARIVDAVGIIVSESCWRVSQVRWRPAR